MAYTVCHAPEPVTSYRISNIITQESSSLNDGRTHGAPYRGYGYVTLRFGGNVVRRMGTQQRVSMKSSRRNSAKVTTTTVSFSIVAMVIDLGAWHTVYFMLISNY